MESRIERYLIGRNCPGKKKVVKSQVVLKVELRAVGIKCHK